MARPVYDRNEHDLHSASKVPHQEIEAISDMILRAVCAFNQRADRMELEVYPG